MAWVWTDATSILSTSHPGWLARQQLVAQGAIPKNSGDGLSAYSSTGSVFTATTPYAAGANGWGNQKAWESYLLPNGTYLCIINGAGSTTWSHKVKIARAAFTGGSPSATQAPSATGEATIAGGGTDASPTYTALSQANRVTLGKWISCAQTAAPYGFWGGVLGAGGETLQGFVYHDPVLEYGTGDPDPMVYRWTSADVNFVGAWSEIGPATYGWFSSAWGTMDAAFDGFLSSSGALQQIASGTNCIGANPSNGLYPGPPVDWGRSTRFSAPRGPKGVSTLFRQNLFNSQRSGLQMSQSGALDTAVLYSLYAYWPGRPFTVP